MLWWKAFHLFFLIAWFAGLFYLPRLFVYHASTDDAPGRARFTVMERRLFVMMTIGAVGTLGSGLVLALAWWRPWPSWLVVKVALVALLLIHHYLCWRHLRAFAAGTNTRSALYFRVFNEVPTLLLLGIVLLVTLKPV